MEKNEPMILTGLRKICSVFNVGVARVKDWVKRGAPIVQGRDGSYRADYHELWEWFKQNEAG